MDEYHQILLDSSFKADTEWTFVNTVKDAKRQTWISATPILEEFVSDIPHLRDLPVVELVSESQQVYNVERMRTEQPVETAAEVLMMMREGRSPLVTKDGEKAEQLVVFLNSVNDIIRLVSACKLKPEEVNLIMADQEENRRAVEALGEGFQMGSIPLEGQPHKPFTLTTSTAFQGVDMMQERAMSIVVSDCNRSHTAIDIACMLPQIAGRLRKSLFKDTILFIHNDHNDERDMAEVLQSIDEKSRQSQELVQFLNTAAIPPMVKGMLRDCIARDNQSTRYRFNFVHYNPQTHQFAQNALPRISE